MKKGYINIFLASFVFFLSSCSINKIHQINIPRSENTSKILSSSTKKNLPSSSAFDGELINTQFSSFQNSSSPKASKLVKGETKIDKILNVVLSQNQQLLYATKKMITPKENKSVLNKNESTKPKLITDGNGVYLGMALIALIGLIATIVKENK